jgi:hypothetical protein
LKLIASLLVSCILVGCAQPTKEARARSGQTPLTQKLEGMTVQQRVDYVKTHMDEVTGSTGMRSTTHKRP